MQYDWQTNFHCVAPKVLRSVSLKLNIPAESTSPIGIAPREINGRFAIERELLDELIKNGQIASQFVDERGYAIIDAPYNLTGSEYAIESLTSPDGLILGRLGDVTATDKNLYKNNRQQYNDLEFEAGVNFCKL